MSKITRRAFIGSSSALTLGALFPSEEIELKVGQIWEYQNLRMNQPFASFIPFHQSVVQRMHYTNTAYQITHINEENGQVLLSCLKNRWGHRISAICPKKYFQSKHKKYRLLADVKENLGPWEIT